MPATVDVAVEATVLLTSPRGLVRARPGDMLRVTGRASPHGYAVTLLRDGNKLTSGRLAVPAIAAQGDALRRVEAVHG